MAQLKQYTKSEIKKNDDKDKVLVLLHDKVFNVHTFLNEHPGGEEVLLEHKGIDASEDFDDVGHSNDAMELMKKYQVGVLVESERKNKAPKKGWVAGYRKDTEKENQDSSMTFYLFVGGFMLVLAILLYAY